MIKTATNRPIREIRFLFPRNQDFSSQNVIDRITECRDNERRINDSPIDVVRRIVGYDFCFFLFFFSFSSSSSIEFLFIELNDGKVRFVRTGSSSYIAMPFHRTISTIPILNLSIVRILLTRLYRSLLSFTADRLFSNSFDHGTDTTVERFCKIIRIIGIIKLIFSPIFFPARRNATINLGNRD